MRKIYIFMSEMDTSIHVCNDTDLDKFEKKYNKPIRISTKLQIKPWSLICNIEFPREQTANAFEQFLKTKDGLEFANKHLLFNPLAELKKLLEMLPKSCQVYVMGGLALDGHNGSLTRKHDDADLICWRKDVKTVKNALKKIGYGIKEHCYDDKPKMPYLLETDEDNPAISFFIIDNGPNNSFKFNSLNLHEIFPNKYLGSKKVSLSGVKFSAVSISLLDFLNKKGQESLKYVKKNNPKLYNALGYKITNNKNDRKLINKLMKK